MTSKTTARAAANDADGAAAPAASASEEAAPDSPPPPPDQDALSVKDLARAVLDRSIKRPRVGSIRRLAEAVLAKGGKKKAKKKTGGKKARKLATIPGQKGR